MTPAPVKDMGVIKSLFVDTPYRGRGIGSLLLERSEELAAQANWEKLSASWFHDARFAGDIQACFEARDWALHPTSASLT